MERPLHQGVRKVVRQIIGGKSTYRARGTSACELQDAVRSNFCPIDIFVQAELGKRRVGGDSHGEIGDW
jgi:hypothetical protein